jgi:hypothetical protein
MFKFEHVYKQEGYPSLNVVVETDAEKLDDLLDNFEYFLRGASFVFKGHLEIVPDEQENEHDKI